MSSRATYNCKNGNKFDTKSQTEGDFAANRSARDFIAKRRVVAEMDSVAPQDREHCPTPVLRFNNKHEQTKFCMNKNTNKNVPFNEQNSF